MLERKYRVDAVVAEGGCGVVYAGHHLSLDVKVALKVLKPSRSLDASAWDDLLAAFLEEAKTLARLRHPNIVAVLDSGVTHVEGALGAVPWMALEWLEGVTLLEDLARRRGAGGRAPAACMETMGPILDAIGYAHAQGIAHRDIKPSNVMLVRAEHGESVRVLDFGIAKILEPEMAIAAPSGDTATQSRVSAFTPASAAPEQLAGARTGPWTDVFALGLLLTEMLTDQAPVPAGDTSEHLRVLFATERPTPARLGVDVGAWEEIVARALALKPGDRQPNARALRSELERALPEARHARVGPPPAPPREPTEPTDGGYAATDRRLRTGRARVAVGLGLAGALAVGAALYARHALHSAPIVADASPPRECDSNRACVTAHGGEASVCTADGKCVAVASEDCVVRAEPEDLLRDDTLWVGTLLLADSTSGAELARRDLAAARQFSPTSSDGHARRPIALVSCDEARDRRRAARHLVDDLRVPALVGFGPAQEALDLLATDLLPKGTLSLVSRNTSSLITAVPMPAGAPRLVWRTTNSTTDMARALAVFTAEYVEPAMRRARGRPLRVALIRPANSTGVGFSDSLVSLLRFNGASVPENGERFVETVVERPPSADAGSPVALAPFLAMQPDIVVFFGSYFIPWVVLPLEAAWPSGAPRPVYLDALPFDEEALALLPAGDASLRRRMFAVQTETYTAVNTKFTLHYNATFTDKVTPVLSPNTTYDALFLLGYAVHALPAGPVDGASIARAFPRLLGPGPRIEVGPAQILEALGSLDRGETIDLQGAGTDLDLDARTGESPTNQVILCLEVGADGRTKALDSGLLLDAKTGKMRGPSRCH
jgi:serine/threonine-protein kinase